MTAGMIIAALGGLSLLLSVVLHHRRETAALYLHRTPERDAGFDEGVELAAKLVEHLVTKGGDVDHFKVKAARAIRAARRGGGR